MFEAAELGQKISKEIYKKEEPKLRQELLNAQYELKKQSKFPVIVLIAGVDGAGKGETVNLLNEWMDPRYIETRAFGLPNEVEHAMPPMWRFWMNMPAKGRIGIFFGHWYTAPILERAYGDIKTAELDAALSEIRHFEKMLYDEGALLLKFWFHLSKKLQRKRLKKLAADKDTAWRVTKTDWKHFELYDEFRKISERALRESSQAYAPWTIVEGTDPEYRSLTVGRTLLDALKKRLKNPEPPKPMLPQLPAVAHVKGKRMLDTLDLTRTLTDKDYDKQLTKLQGRLNLLLRNPDCANIALTLVFEGCDAAGKGGTIRRVTQALDARQYRIVPIAAPTDEERAHPYLWRFWRRLGQRGTFTIFDRSWYGRVLVERVEGFCAESDWQRAYTEINDFEEQLYRANNFTVKFWLQVSKEEQLRRFKEREATPFKRFKITEEDWRNREKWDAYQNAVNDMVERTSTELAPWHLISSQDKRAARIDVLNVLCDTIEAALKRAKKRK
ncbi:Polyphosphate:AMP phosphotransferase [Planctomycetaceae bacterium]|nr:Polyphosphate:AMP phosphotransferase [Planctomycetaceae bacterium]